MGFSNRLRLRQVTRTPLVDSPWLSGLTGATVRLKLETAQPIRSFKIRGAANCLLSAPRASLARGVWTASAGNMAQGAAWVARELSVACRVVVPEQAPRAKTDAVEALGASTERVPFDAWWAAMATGAHPGMDGFFVHPFADPLVMAGNGTIGLELAEDAPGAVQALGVPHSNMTHLTNWIVNGMPERFPNLKTLWIESGLAWVPFIMQRLDHLERSLEKEKTRW